MTKIKEMELGEQYDSFFFLREKLIKETRTGKEYMDILLEDDTATISAKIWEIDSQVFGEISSGDFVKARVSLETYRDQKQLKIFKVRKVKEEDYNEGFDETSCFKKTNFDIDEMWDEIRDISSGCSPKISELLISILDKFSERFRVWPAAVKIHHAYVGGLLEHTLSVTKTCLYFVDKYEISKDLLVCAAILHDIGKLEELSKKSGAEYTEKGQLIGHIVLGRDIVREHASEIPDFPEDFLILLEHLILSHQGQTEWGTVKVPMTLEALLLHYADDIDAKFNHVSNFILDDESEGFFTRRSAIMNRTFLKQQKNMDEKN
tara:strand:- start:2478 stop:3437 length:960 start_codon:yes stop_codon:yes gene_type:complete